MSISGNSGYFSSWLRDTPDIHRFPTVHMVKTNFLLENLSISEPSLGEQEKFQCCSALPNIKYKFTILCLYRMYWLFIYFSNIFSYRPSLKNLVRIFWSPRKRQNLLNFLHGIKIRTCSESNEFPKFSKFNKSLKHELESI